MKIYEGLISGKEKIAVVGMGYVGFPLAVNFAENGVNVIGFDINNNKIKKYIEGEDPTDEIGAERLKKADIDFTSDPERLKEAKFIIVAVPTPVLYDKTPDLKPVKGASEIVGRNMSKGTIVSYESTVYPGLTEEICLPILEEESGMKSGVDFKIAYSPERINPGDRVHTVETIVKVVSGMDQETLDEVAKIYEIVVKAGVFKAASIKVAEACKVVENAHRDINIAFMNEVAIMFDRMNIDTKDVIDAMKTKWNALNFYPGLVGGHCIGVDPSYLVYKSFQAGYESKLISAARKINDDVALFIARKTIEILEDKKIKKPRVGILGITFKENVPDHRNSKVVDIIERLKVEGIDLVIADSHAEASEIEKEYGVVLNNFAEFVDLDALIIAVDHKEYKELSIKNYLEMFKKDYKKPIVLDIKGTLNREEAEENFDYWRL